MLINGKYIGKKLWEPLLWVTMWAILFICVLWHHLWLLMAFGGLISAVQQYSWWGCSSWVLDIIFPLFLKHIWTTINYLNFIGWKCSFTFFYYALGTILNTLCILSNTMRQKYYCCHFIDEETEALERLNNWPRMTLCGGTWSVSFTAWPFNSFVICFHLLRSSKKAYSPHVKLIF